MLQSELFEKIDKIKQAQPENLMVRHFDKQYFSALDKDKQQRLLKIIASGLQNPNSQMGAYAMQPDDYDIFSSFFEPMIRDYHNIKKPHKITQKTDWNSEDICCDLKNIDEKLNNISMRVRVARNVNCFPLTGAMSKNERIEFEKIIADAFKTLIKNPQFGGKYLSLTPNSPYEMSQSEYQKRVNSHQMFKDMSKDKYLNDAGISANWPYGRGIYISQNEDFLVWVGEEDHLRIMAMQIGSDLNALFNHLHFGLGELSELLPDFATSATYGNITSCPTNLGASMRASLHIKLPNLTNNGKDLSELKNIATTLGLSIRGAKGEHSGAGENGLVDISPSARLGVSEIEIMHQLYQGVAKLIELEKE